MPDQCARGRLPQPVCPDRRTVPAKMHGIGCELPHRERRIRASGGGRHLVDRHFFTRRGVVHSALSFAGLVHSPSQGHRAGASQLLAWGRGVSGARQQPYRRARWNDCLNPASRRRAAHALPQMALPRRPRSELGRDCLVLSASSHGHSVLRPVLPVEPATRLKLPGVGAVSSSLSVRPNQPCYLDDASLRGGFRVGVETT
jgi:hypothetical protein